MNQALFSNIGQPQIIQGYSQPVQQFVQRQNYVVGPTTPQPVYSANQYPRLINPRVFFNNQQIVRSPVAA